MRQKAGLLRIDRKSVSANRRGERGNDNSNSSNGNDGVEESKSDAADGPADQEEEGVGYDVIDTGGAPRPQVLSYQYSSTSHKF